MANLDLKKKQNLNCKIKQNLSFKTHTNKTKEYVGILTSDGRQSLKRVGGTWPLIAIEPEAGAVKFWNIAIDKHAGMDQHFCKFEDYVLLLYPDTKVLPPGSNESFTVEKYKHFLNKPYSKINFFVCLETQFLSFVENKNNALENNDNENKDKH